ncbi:hypothetical protein [Novosphingobium nitrogenifigens]|uniref:hypothetical protein n=1 Tax=Novosphingobium nitrogenifigens TaxID=378548 RepID=UPI0012F49AB2|nr:hypothetical protein [Novosphingobium nitrogenifigens]
MFDLESLLEKRIIRDVNFLRISGAGCFLVAFPALSFNRTERGWTLDGPTLVAAALVVAGVSLFFSGALVARTLRKFGNHHAPDLALNRYEGGE